MRRQICLCHFLTSPRECTGGLTTVFARKVNVTKRASLRGWLLGWRDGNGAKAARFGYAERALCLFDATRQFANACATGNAGRWFRGVNGVRAARLAQLRCVNAEHPDLGDAIDGEGIAVVDGGDFASERINCGRRPPPGRFQGPVFNASCRGSRPERLQARQRG